MTATSALRSYESQLRLGQERLVQEAASTEVQSVNNRREGDTAVGRARVSSAAGNVSGTTADELVSEFRMIEAENENSLRTNLEWYTEQMGEQFKALESGAASRINAALPEYVSGPSPLSLALNIGGSLLDNQARVNGNLPDSTEPKDTFEAFVGLF